MPWNEEKFAQQTGALLRAWLDARMPMPVKYFLIVWEPDDGAFLSMSDETELEIIIQILRKFLDSGEIIPTFIEM